MKPRIAWAAVLLLGVAGAPGPAVAQRPPDTTAEARSQVGAERTWPALALGAAAIAVLPLDESIARALADGDVQGDGRLADLADGFRVWAFPGTVLLAGGLYVAGRLGDERGTATMGLRAMEAIVLAEAATAVGKSLAGRARPEVAQDDPFDFQLTRGVRRGDRYQSFPSGHTAAAFALAAAVTAENRHCCAGTTQLLGPVLYGGAVLAGLSRMYEGRHWASDALAGAALGTYTGLRVVSYHHRKPGAVPDRWLLPSAAAPFEGGVMLVWVRAAR